MSKVISKTYLFSSYPKYEEKLFKAMMGYERVDKASDAFQDVIDDVTKRKTTDNMVKVLKSDAVVLLYGGDPLDKALKVFAAVDMKSGGAQKTKVFIDCSNIITKENGIYKCSNIGVLLAYIFDAMVSYIYYVSESTIVNNATLSKSGTNIFANLFAYIVDYIYKINSMNGARYKCMYLASLYYQVNILGKDLNSEAVQHIARDIANISITESNIIMIDLEEDDFANIKTFIDAVANVLNMPKLGIDAVVAKWMHIFGTGTVFALELYPSFSAMITDACTDTYLNNQNTIEKVVGAKLMKDYYSKLIEISGRV